MQSESPSPAAAPTRRAWSAIRIVGGDALPLLHRLSTQFLLDLTSGTCRAAPFCDYRGRLLHRAAVAVARDLAVWLLRDDAPGDELVAFVERHVFREDVRCADLGQRHGVLPAAGGAALPAGAVEEHDGIPLRVQLAPDFALTLAGEDAAASPGEELRRIRAGRPRHGHEIHTDFHPFEVGLAHEVHLGKGCYPGQEALLRMVTYRGVRRRLVRLGGRGVPPPVPRDVRAGGAVVGRLTSAMRDGADGWIGLGVLREKATAPGAPALEIEGAGTLLAPEPFPTTSPRGLP